MVTQKLKQSCTTGSNSYLEKWSTVCLFSCQKMLCQLIHSSLKYLHKYHHLSRHSYTSTAISQASCCWERHISFPQSHILTVPFCGFQHTATLFPNSSSIIYSPAQAAVPMSTYHTAGTEERTALLNHQAFPESSGSNPSEQPAEHLSSTYTL